MKSKRKILMRLLALAIVIGVAVTMFIIGRGHTIYFDNKDLEADGTSYEAFYQIEVLVNDVPVCKLNAGDRGMVETMGQNFEMFVRITPKKDAKKIGGSVKLKLPYNMDGIIFNLPAMINGAPEEVYQEEFIPAPVEEDTDEDVVVTDEFEMPMGDE